MAPLTNTVGDWVVRWLWPSVCVACRRQPAAAVTPYFCATCWATMRRLTAPWCPRCGAPFLSPIALAWSPAHVCADCRARPPVFDTARAAVAYDGVAVAAIRLLKYDRRLSLARSLGALLDPLLPEMGPMDGVVPVPLHVDRLREREFNQALALARVVCRRAGWPLWWNLLERVRDTRAQVGLDAAARRRNLRGAFAVRRPERLEGRRVVLLDDVLTTGSTVNECARALKRAGAATVAVLAIARQVRA
jgi:ComF family protein